MPGDIEEKRLAWACRRGMLELDVVLQHFLKHRYAGLPEQDKSLFSHLLESPDPVLQSYLNGDSSADDAALQDLIEKIRFCLGNSAR